MIEEEVDSKKLRKWTGANERAKEEKACGKSARFFRFQSWDDWEGSAYRGGGGVRDLSTAAGPTEII